MQLVLRVELSLLFVSPLANVRNVFEYIGTHRLVNKPLVVHALYFISAACYATCSVCVVRGCIVISSTLCYTMHVIYAGMSKSTSSQQLLVYASHCP